MPNHCENDLIITGPKDELAAFLEAAHGLPEHEEEKDDPISLRRLVPRPPEENKNWYEWNIKNWGTKWGMYDFDDFGDPVLSEGGTIYTVSFRSAWGPPETAIEAIAKSFPALTFDLCYYESGMAFKGQLVVKGGEILTQWGGDYHGNRGG